MCHIWNDSVDVVGLEDMVSVLQRGPSEMGLSAFSPGVGVHGSFHKSQPGGDEKGNVCGTLLPLAFPICF